MGSTQSCTGEKKSRKQRMREQRKKRLANRRAIKIEPADAIVKTEPQEPKIQVKQEFSSPSSISTKTESKSNLTDFDISLSDMDLLFEEKDSLIVSLLQWFALPNELTGPTFENIILAVIEKFC